MDAFAFRTKLVSEYAAFTRSFTCIRGPDIQVFVDEAYTRRLVLAAWDAMAKEGM